MRKYYGTIEEINKLHREKVVEIFKDPSNINQYIVYKNFEYLGVIVETLEPDISLLNMLTYEYTKIMAEKICNEFIELCNIIQISFHSIITPFIVVGLKNSLSSLIFITVDLKTEKFRIDGFEKQYNYQEICLKILKETYKVF